MEGTTMMPKLQHQATLVAVMFATLIALLGGVATGGNPHFLDEHSQATLQPTGELLLEAKVVGLGEEQLIEIEASADTEAIWACVNRGNNHPMDVKKEHVRQLHRKMWMSANRAGHLAVAAKLQLSEPEDPDFLICPGNQVRKLAKVTFRKMKIVDLTHEKESTAFPEELSRTLIKLKVKEEL
jgi:hypothetical protein